MGLHVCKVCQEFLVSRRERHNLTGWNGVIAGPGQHTRLRSANLDLHFTETAVKVLIGTAVSEGVTRTDLRVDSLETTGDIVGILQEASASVFRDSIQQVLLPVQPFVPTDVKNAFAGSGPSPVFHISSC